MASALQEEEETRAESKAGAVHSRFPPALAPAGGGMSRVMGLQKPDSGGDRWWQLEAPPPPPGPQAGRSKWGQGIAGCLEGQHPAGGCREDVDHAAPHVLKPWRAGCC